MYFKKTCLETNLTPNIRRHNNYEHIFGFQIYTKSNIIEMICYDGMNLIKIVICTFWHLIINDEIFPSSP